MIFINDTATPEIYTLSLHDALPIWCRWSAVATAWGLARERPGPPVSRSHSAKTAPEDRKSTRLNSSHQIISYAVFCLKKKKTKKTIRTKIKKKHSKYGPTNTTPPNT